MLTLPARAAWRHVDAREGFEALFLKQAAEGGHVFDGSTSACEDGQVWVVSYTIEVDAAWRTRRAHVTAQTETGPHEVHIETDGEGHWRINQMAAPHLDGCFDLDLESSSFTNAFPIHRLNLETGQMATAPAAYVRALDLRVERLEQDYQRLADDGTRSCFDYNSPGFNFRCRLVYDANGLILDYPGIAVRVA